MKLNPSRSITGEISEGKEHEERRENWKKERERKGRVCGNADEEGEREKDEELRGRDLEARWS